MKPTIFWSEVPDSKVALVTIYSAPVKLWITLYSRLLHQVATEQHAASHAPLGAGVGAAVVRAVGVAVGGAGALGPRGQFTAEHRAVKLYLIRYHDYYEIFLSMMTMSTTRAHNRYFGASSVNLLLDIRNLLIE